MLKCEIFILFCNSESIQYKNKEKYQKFVLKMHLKFCSLIDQIPFLIRILESITLSMQKFFVYEFCTASAKRQGQEVIAATT